MSITLDAIQEFKVQALPLAMNEPYNHRQATERLHVAVSPALKQG